MATTQETELFNPYKIRLTPASTGAGRSITFNASPTISENRNVNYAALEPLHAPGGMQVYRNTSSRNFQLSDVKIISRTQKEAERNLQTLWFLRAWCMPRFGNSSTLEEKQRLNREARERGEMEDIDINVDYGNELLGAPPPVLYLSAYSKSVAGTTLQDAANSKGEAGTSSVWTKAQHINKVPVVIQQLTIPYPNDVDYIITKTGTPMPTIMNIDVGLLETHSPNAYEQFNLDAFKNGILMGF